MGMQLIEHIEVGAGGASSIEFTSIPQDGVDLVLVVSARTTLANNHDSVYVVVNNDTSTTYQHIVLRGYNSTVQSFSLPTTLGLYAGNTSGSTSTSNTFGNFAVAFSNYTSTTNKSVSADSVSENNSSDAHAAIVAASYPNSSAISSLKLVTNASNFVQYSTASLYKIY